MQWNSLKCYNGFVVFVAVDLRLFGYAPSHKPLYQIGVFASKDKLDSGLHCMATVLSISSARQNALVEIRKWKSTLLKWLRPLEKVHV